MTGICTCGKSYPTIREAHGGNSFGAFAIDRRQVSTGSGSDRVSTHSTRVEVVRMNPVATAPGTDLVFEDLKMNAISFFASREVLTKSRARSKTRRPPPRCRSKQFVK